MNQYHPGSVSRPVRRQYRPWQHLPWPVDQWALWSWHCKRMNHPAVWTGQGHLPVPFHTHPMQYPRITLVHRSVWSPAEYYTLPVYRKWVYRIRYRQHRTHGSRTSNDTYALTWWYHERRGHLGSVTGSRVWYARYHRYHHHQCLRRTRNR